MKLVYSLRDFVPDPSRPLVLALGNFDGLHRGHALLLKRAVGRARRLKGRAAVLTFREHPQRVLHPGRHIELIQEPVQKLSGLEHMGIGLCFWLHFTKDFSRLEARDFVERILVDRLGVKEFYLGDNAHFGHDRKGNAVLMSELAGRYGFRFREVRPLKAGKNFVTSSEVRFRVSSGKLREAARLLGRRFSLFAEVVKGSGRGRKLGFPTANLKTHPNQVMPPSGVYPVRVRQVYFPKQVWTRHPAQFPRLRYERWMKGVLNLGFRPTFKKKSAHPVAEVHVFGFRRNLYGTWLEVEFLERLRPERIFSSPAVLAGQIARDIARAKKLLS